ncbi:MAG: ribosome maturation factor RimM [Campylobacterales bacterium]
MSSDALVVAKIGKSFGLFGELRLHLLSDFPELFVKGAIFECENHPPLEIEHYHDGKVKFLGINTKEDASYLTNRQLYMSKEKTEEIVPLGEDELFYHQIDGFVIVDEGKTIATIKDIERIGNIDYFIVTPEVEGFTKGFMIPYIDRYVIKIDKEKKEIITKDCFGIMEES